jgi:hypothetical protein
MGFLSQQCKVVLNRDRNEDKDGDEDGDGGGVVYKLLNYCTQTSEGK